MRSSLYIFPLQLSLEQKLLEFFYSCSACGAPFDRGMRCIFRRNKCAGCSLSGQSCWVLICINTFPVLASVQGQEKGLCLSFSGSEGISALKADTGTLHLSVSTAVSGMIHGTSVEDGIFLKRNINKTPHVSAL